MVDIVFACSSCHRNLAIEESAVGTKVPCPHCSAETSVPVPALRFRCPACNAALCAHESLGKTTAECPNCGCKLDVGHLTTPRCVGCGLPVGRDDVICVKCGTNQRTGVKATTSPETTGRLRFKDEPVSSVVPSGVESIVNRFRPRVHERPSMSERLTIFLKPVAFLILIVGGAVLLLRFADLSAIGKSLHGLFAGTPQAITVVSNLVAKVAVTNDGAATNAIVDLHVVRGIIQNLEDMQRNPIDPVAIKRLSDFVRCLTDANESRLMRAALRTVVGLEFLASGNESTGLSTLGGVRTTYADTEYASLADVEALRDVCPKCQKGETGESCLYCVGSGKCQTCGGKGTRQATKAAPLTLRKGGGSRKLGEPAETVTVDVSCAVCGGSGRCRECDGAAKIVSKCKPCCGTGKILSAAKATTRLDTALAKALDYARTVEKSGHDLVIVRQTPSVEELGEILSDATRMSLFDALIRVGCQEGMQLAIDPESLPMLSKIRVETSVLASATNTSTLADLLGQYRLILRSSSVSVDGSSRVNMVTTGPVWAYSQACWFMQNQQLDRALQSLDQVENDRSEFGRHCQQLQSVLDSMHAKQADISRTAGDIRKLSEECQSNFRNAQMVWRAAHSGLKRPGWNGRLGEATVDEGMVSVAVSKYVRSIENLRSVAASLDHLIQAIRMGNEVVLSQFCDARGANLKGEAYFLLNSLANNFETLLKLCEEIDQIVSSTGNSSGLDGGQMETQRQQLAKTVKGCREQLGDNLPDHIRQLQRELGDDIRTSVVDVEINRKRSATDEGFAAYLKSSNDAFTRDRTSVMARAAVGRCLVRQHALAVRDLLQGGRIIDAEVIKELSREFRNRQKRSLLEALCAATGTGVTLPIEEPAGKTASAVGLAVVVTEEGEALPLSVKIGTITKKEVKVEKKVETYWGAVTERFTVQTDAFPISFGDYGNKDIYMWMSAVEVYKWLNGTYQTNMNGRGLTIEFQDLVANKGGDSAGVTMAVAGYSALMGKSVRRDVAMTGSLRSDGSVHAVGGVFLKVGGAIRAQRVETVVIPRENEADAMLVPLDSLCRICIVSGEDIQTYLNYATDPYYNAEAMATLHRAQALILTGNWRAAEPFLLRVAQNSPEVYSARRLLQLISIAKRAAPADGIKTVGL